MGGETFRRELEDQLVQALDKLNTSFLFGSLSQLISTARAKVSVSCNKDRRRPSRAGSKFFKRLGSRRK